MTNRRDFIQKSLLGTLALPLLGMDFKLGISLEELKNLRNDDGYWEMVRKQFPLRTDQTYFNNATMGPTSSYVLDKMMHHLLHFAEHGAEINYKNESGPELLTGYFPYESLRKKIGEIIHADYKEVSLIQNATFGMNYVAMGLDLKKGDELLNTNQEHGGGFAAWQLLAKRKGCIYKQATMPVPANDPQEIVDAIFKEVTKKTRVIAIPHIVSIYGVVMPVKEICEEARKRNIFTIIDGAQSVGQIKVNVKEIGCDAYYSSLHKWMLAPAGSGILYVRNEVVKDIWSTIASYNWENADDHGFRLMQNGTGNPAVLAGFDAAVDFYNTIGEDRWVGRIKELGDHLRAGLKDLKNVTVHSSTHPQMCAGMTTYEVAGVSGPDVQKTLWEKERLQPRSVSDKLVRHSVHIYNSKSEIDRAINAIAAL
jgi:isopenicillin-N epimerase